MTRVLPGAFALMLAVQPAMADELVVPDGGIPADYNCPPADQLVALPDGGYFMSEARALRISCLLAATEADRDLLRANQGVTSASGGSIALAVITVVVSVLGGAVLGYQFRRATHK